MAPLVAFEAGKNDTGGFMLRSPSRAGDHELHVHVDARDGTHEPVTASIRLTTLPHATSMAIWDVPFPIVERSTFAVKVGVTCECGCCLSGHDIQVEDASGAVRGTARLTDRQWADTHALYWTEVPLTAPSGEAQFHWFVGLVPRQTDPPHTLSRAAFDFITSAEPRFEVCVQLLERNTGAPIPDAEVRLGRYQARSDASGESRFFLPGGSYATYVRKDGIDVPSTIVAIDDHLSLELLADRVPSHAEVVEMMRRFEGEYWRR